MSFTAVLSGPQGRIKHVHSALEAAGFHLVLDAGGQPTLDDHGNAADTPKGHVFVTVEGDDINVAHSAVLEHGWRLRVHWNNDDMGYAAGLGSPGYLSPAERLARVEMDLAILKVAE